MPRLDPRLTPFCGCGYVIVDAERPFAREISIHADDPLAPQLGDRFTVERRGVVHEVAVIETDRCERGWRAVCRITDVF
ncbi:MAG: hypothetical protein DI570_19345 [Phenylobacterium zucineum]|nr:MAG: hypothetical protein DI570_19345 [Phenylobacterium zucineum]